MTPQVPPALLSIQPSAPQCRTAVVPVAVVPVFGPCTVHYYRTYDMTDQPGTLFGYTEEQLSEFLLNFGVPAFILFMLFIIGHLAWESKAGKFGTFVLFLGLAVGFIGFIAKGVIQWFIAK